jgi:hypothetical protein
MCGWGHPSSRATRSERSPNGAAEHCRVDRFNQFYRHLGFEHSLIEPHQPWAGAQVDLVSRAILESTSSATNKAVKTRTGTSS